MPDVCGTPPARHAQDVENIVVQVADNVAVALSSVGDLVLFDVDAQAITRFDGCGFFDHQGRQAALDRRCRNAARTSVQSTHRRRAAQRCLAPSTFCRPRPVETSDEEVARRTACHQGISLETRSAPSARSPRWRGRRRSSTPMPAVVSARRSLGSHGVIISVPAHVRFACSRRASSLQK